MSTTRNGVRSGKLGPENACALGSGAIATLRSVLSHGLPITRWSGLDEELADHARGRHTVELGLRVEQQTVGEHWLSEHLDIVWDHVVATTRGCERLCRTDEGKCASNADAQSHLDRRARSINETRDVVVDRWVDVNCPCLLCELAYD